MVASLSRNVESAVEESCLTICRQENGFSQELE